MVRAREKKGLKRQQTDDTILNTVDIIVLATIFRAWQLHQVCRIGVGQEAGGGQNVNEVTSQWLNCHVWFMFVSCSVCSFNNLSNISENQE